MDLIDNLESLISVGFLGIEMVAEERFELPTRGL